MLDQETPFIYPEKKSGSFITKRRSKKAITSGGLEWDSMILRR